MRHPMRLTALVAFVCLALQPTLLSQEQGAIESVLVHQAEAWNRGDIAGYMQGYWMSDSLLFTSGGHIQRGWKATFEKYTKSYDSPAKMGKLKFSDLEIHQLSESSAWVFGHWELSREKDRPAGVFTLVMKKFADGWKVVHDHTSSEVPAQGDTTKSH